jgi:O-antigen/teichoic acid export membrane protein
VIVMFMDAIAALPFARLRFEHKALKFALGKLINILILVGLSLYFLKVAYDPAIGISYVMLALLIANGFYFLFLFKTLFTWRPTFDKKISWEMFHYSYPMMLMGLAGMTNEMFSRLTLEWWLPENFYPGQSSEYALGIFGACFKFGMLMSLTVTAFRYAADPFFFSNAADKNSPKLFAKVNHYFVIVCCVLLLGVGTNLDILKYFLADPAYWEGLSIVPILLLAYLFLGVYYNFSVWYKLTDRTYFGTLITTGGAVITIVLNFLLIPKFGYMGSSWATLICYFTMAMVCYWLGQKFYPIPYTIFKSIGYIVFTTGLVYVVNSVPLPTPWMAIGFHAVVMLVYLFIVYLLEKRYFLQPVV